MLWNQAAALWVTFGLSMAVTYSDVVEINEVVEYV